MKIKISSIGCRLNQSEIESVSTALQMRGHNIIEHNDADVFIINSCVVTLHSERKTRKLIYRAQRAINPGKKCIIIVTGCASPELIQDRNIFYVPNDFKHLIPDIIDHGEIPDKNEQFNPERFSLPAPAKASTTRVNLKIQDGCDNFCTYCIVPYMRGAPQSKPVDAVLREFDELLEAGYKEIVLSGVVIGSYQDGPNDLASLVENLLSMQGNYRVHLSSLSPELVSPALINLLEHPSLVKHLHLSLQSGSDSVLKRMNRRYTRQEYIDLATRIRKQVPLINLTTDVIVGFPGETEKDFIDTLNIIREVKFSHVHSFRFTPRAGTEAAKMKETVEEKEKTKRNRVVIDLFREYKWKYFRQFDGTKSIFLSERFRKGKTSGFNEYYIPIIIGERLKRNQLWNVTTRFKKGALEMEGLDPQAIK